MCAKCRHEMDNVRDYNGTVVTSAIVEQYPEHFRKVVRKNGKFHVLPEKTALQLLWEYARYCWIHLVFAVTMIITIPVNVKAGQYGLIFPAIFIVIYLIYSMAVSSEQITEKRMIQESVIVLEPIHSLAALVSWKRLSPESAKHISDYWAKSTSEKRTLLQECLKFEEFVETVYELVLLDESTTNPETHQAVMDGFAALIEKGQVNTRNKARAAREKELAAQRAREARELQRREEARDIAAAAPDYSAEVLSIVNRAVVGN